MKNLDVWQEGLSIALQADLENSVRWLNEKAAAEFKRKYPALNEWIEQFMGAADEAGAVKE